MTLGFSFEREKMNGDVGSIVQAKLLNKERLRVVNTFIFKDYVERKHTIFEIGFILEYLLKVEFNLASIPNNIVFLPTSRTGFLLTYKTLVRESISSAYDWEDRPADNYLTRPCSDFLKNLASVDPAERDEKYQEVISFIEDKMVGGHILLSRNTPQPTIRYQPKLAERDFPLHLASGVVTELTPLLLMLQYHYPLEALFIEEPEMELHPALQSEMAKVLNRIRKRDTCLFVATHSDIILQQLNNMVKLGGLSEPRQKEFMARFGYEEEDIVDPEDIALYQLNVNPEDGKTSVEPLAYNEYGFLVPTFNDAFEKLLKETRELEKDEE